MELKLDKTINNNIFIYGKLSPSATAQILFSKIAVMENSTEFLPVISQLKAQGGKLWLIRESRMVGLLTVQSVSYDQSKQLWQQNDHERYMLSNNHGWMLNGKKGAEFEQKVKDAGGIIDMTEANAGSHVHGLLTILSDSGYVTHNRINPKKGEETNIKGYTKYVDSSAPSKAISNWACTGRTITPTFFQPRIDKGDTSVSLPEGIMMALSCPLTIKQTGVIQLMKDPVTLLCNGITYERDSLWELDHSLKEGVDYYPNIKIRTIISYVSATHLGLDGYLDKLAKVEGDILDPVHMEVMQQPILSPSGHSFEKDSLEQWIKTREKPDSPDTPIPDPLTNLNIRGKQLVENINLKLFIQFWPEFYESRKAMTPIPNATSVARIM